jgi:hypothetical protein
MNANSKVMNGGELEFFSQAAALIFSSAKMSGD